jgi:hypothetical protein
VITQRRREADEFYAEVIPAHVGDDERLVARQAFAGMIWSKQFYCYDVKRWLDGDPTQPTPPQERRTGRNAGWSHLDARDILSMPDPWEYPWFAAWDLAFHTVALTHLDPAFAKYQLLTLSREWFQHPNGALPAYEWSFSDVNPPVHAWAALHVWDIDGRRDRTFLARLLPKLLMNFTWWVNRIDPEGDHVFAGGFLGLDNISAVDRSNLPAGARLEQADGTSWMAFYALTLLEIAKILAVEDDAWTDIEVKFIEHFVLILDAMNFRRAVGRAGRLLLRPAAHPGRRGHPDQGALDRRGTAAAGDLRARPRRARAPGDTEQTVRTVPRTVRSGDPGQGPGTGRARNRPRTPGPRGHPAG